MNRFLTLAAATLAVLASSAAQSAVAVYTPGAFGPDATTVTFETGISMLPVIPGLRFPSTPPFSPHWFSATGGGSGFFGIQSASNLWSGNYSDIAVEFDTPQGTVGAWVGNIPDFLDSTVNKVTLEAFSIGGTSLGSYEVNLSPVSGVATFFGLSSSIGISRVEWRAGNPGFFAIDNLMYQPAAIPEPEVSFLIISGLLVLGAARTRRQAS